jgi:hypothetical protein
MEGLKSWMEAQLDDKKIEPNSGMGKAIQRLTVRMLSSIAVSMGVKHKDWKTTSPIWGI